MIESCIATSPLPVSHLLPVSLIVSYARARRLQLKFCNGQLILHGKAKKFVELSQTETDPSTAALHAVWKEAQDEKVEEEVSEESGNESERPRISKRYRKKKKSSPSHRPHRGTLKPLSSIDSTRDRGSIASSLTLSDTSGLLSDDEFDGEEDGEKKLS